MKKSIINRNYSLLVLILLILFITYVNIPTSSIMKGGSAGTSKYDSMSKDKLTEELMKSNSLFMVLNKYFYGYVGIIVVLISIAIYYYYQLALVQGIPGLVTPVVGWDNEGATFLTQYFILDRENKGLNAPGTVKVPPEALKDFNKNTTDLIGNYRSGVDIFCNIVSPCNICECSGPDPKYEGDPADAPTIPYGGSQCKSTAESFTTVVDGKIVESFAPPTTPAGKINALRLKLDFSHRRFGGIPKCCCHLFNVIGVDIKTVTDSMATLLTDAGSEKQPTTGNELTPILALSDQTKALIPNVRAIRNTTYPIGIYPEVGCEPSEEPEPLKTPSGPVKPNNGNYALAMFQACLSKKPVTYVPAAVTDADAGNEMGTIPFDSTKPNEGKSPYEVNVAECPDYKDKLTTDRGYSSNTIFRNTEFFNAIKNILKQAKNKTPVLTFDIKPYIGVLPTASNSSTPWAGSAWPVAHAAFKGDGLTTEYYYISIASKKYELKIDNYLKEIYAYPIKVGSKRNPYCTIEIKSSDTGGAEASSFLEYGLVKKYMKRVPKELKGLYVFP